MLRKVRLSVLVLVTTLVAGCSKPHPTAFVRWFTEDAASSSKDSNDAYPSYVRASNMAREADPLGLRRVSFTEGQRQASLVRLRPALGELYRATSKGGDFEAPTLMPFVENPNHSGWRLLGRALIWRLEGDLKNENYEEIPSTVREITKFATDLMAGGAAEADLGLSLLDDVRIALAPSLGQLPAATLNECASVLEKEATRDNWLDEAISKEHKVMLAGVQLVQDAYLEGSLSELQANLGLEVREAVDYLNTLHQQSADQQLQYFRGFAKEADTEVAWVRQQAERPVVARKEPEYPEAQPRPWKRFSKHFFRSLRPLLNKDARTLARTRLLVLECRIIAHVKAGGLAPKSLGSYAKGLRQDPFTGREFCYEADGPVFKLYSPGQDFVDNGGKTGEDYETPDLTIER